MVLPAGAGRFRQRKISVKQTLHVLRQRDMPDLDREEQQRELQHVETGVEKGEEEERDLQRVMQATTAKFREGKKNVREASIPTPDASRVWTTKEKLFGDRTYDFTEEYLKFSATVEETSGCPYSIDEEDETFLEELNSKDPSKKLSVDEFEHMMYRLECVEDEKQPFLSMDPKQILGYEEIRQLVEIPPPEGSNERLMQDLGKKLGVGKLETLYDRKAPGQDIRPLHQLMELFGEPVYGHWRKDDSREEGSVSSLSCVLRIQHNSKEMTKIHMYALDVGSIGMQERRDVQICTVFSSYGYSMQISDDWPTSYNPLLRESKREPKKLMRHIRFSPRDVRSNS